MGARRVPFFGVDREFAAVRDEVMAALEETLASGQVLQGPPVKAVEATVAAATGRAHAVAVNSCTDALFFALRAAGVGPGDEVLVPDFSFVASASCILRAGATPVFADIDDTYMLDLDRAAALVGPRTKALIWVHLYGAMADPAPIEKFAAAHGLTLIEDAAQAYGASHRGRPAGSLGLASCISFDPTKVISAPGSGGILVTDDEEVAEQARRLRYHGKAPDGRFVELGYNSQMPSTTAAVLLIKLAHDAEWRARRQDAAGRYHEHLSDLELVLPTVEADTEHVFHKYVLRSPERDRLKAHLADAGVDSMVHYAQPLHQQPAFTGACRVAEGPSRAEQLSAEVLSLPVHPFLDSDEVGTVIDAVRDFHG